MGARAATTACTAFALIVVGWFALAAVREPRVSIRSPGRIASAPADWWVTIVIEPHAEHRQLIVMADGQPGEYRRSDYALEGERAARIRQIWFKSLPAGCYWFTAAVADHQKVLASAIAGPVSIIGLEGNLCAE